MSRTLFFTACLLGLLAVAWVGNGFWGSDSLALTVTLVIGVVYLIGFVELIQYRRATQSLDNALRGISRDDSVFNDPAAVNNPSLLTGWVTQLDASMRDAVRLRIEGERVALPAPVLTPYFVGLLVMLGLLGTFVGMVVTLQGAVFALEGTTELQAIRAGLAAPIKGLGLAFGTSVAGVAASAMLGLASTLCRRERQLASQALDAHSSGVLRPYSLSFQRQAAYLAIQQQAQALPALAASLQLVAERVLATGERLDQSLNAQQNAFHATIEQRFTSLAERLAESVGAALADSGRAAAEVVKPLVSESLQSLQHQVVVLHQQWQAESQSHWERSQESWLALGQQVSSRWEQGLATQAEREQQRLGEWQDGWNSLVERLEASWLNVQQASEQQQHSVQAHVQATSQTTIEQINTVSQQLSGEMTRLLNSTEALVEARQSADSLWQDQQSARLTELTAVLTQQLQSLRDAEDERSGASVQRLAALEERVSEHLQRIGEAVEAPLSRVVESALEAPRAAAELLAALQTRSSELAERDNHTMTERAELMQQVESVLTSLNANAAEQQQTIANLVQATSSTLETVNEQFAATVNNETEKLTNIAADLTASLVEAASFGTAFDAGVKTFSEANTQLSVTLQQITTALNEATARSDEQLAYYVAQAREVIDLSLMSQKSVLNDLRQWSATEKQRLAEVE